MTISPHDLAEISSPNFASTFGRFMAEHLHHEERFTESMKAFGCKIVTPDDGWVNRENNILTVPSYARYVARDIGPGDLICLGSHNRRFRIVRVTRDPGWPRIRRFEFDPLSVVRGGPNCKHPSFR